MSLQFEILKDYIDRNIAVKNVGVRTTYYKDLKRVFAEVELERPWEADREPAVPRPCDGCRRNVDGCCFVDKEPMEKLKGLWSCTHSSKQSC